MMEWNHAVVDRIVDQKHAVLLVGPDETEVIISKDMLPVDAREGSTVKVRFDGSQIIGIELDAHTQNETTRRIAHKMDLLRQRSHRNLE